MGLFDRRKKDVIVGKGSSRPQRSKLRRRLRAFVLVTLGVSAIVLAIEHDRHESYLRSIQIDMEQIARASWHFRLDFGRCPYDVGELAHPPAGGEPYLAREPSDPWGRPYFFKCPGRWSEDEVDIASRGPDGEWMGGDDITTDL